MPQQVTENSNGDMRHRHKDSTLRRSPSYNSAIGSGSDLNNKDTVDNNSPPKHIYGEGEV